MTPPEVDKPVVFIVGSGRSGTTLLYELVCSHPGASWFSNYSQRWPWLGRFHPPVPRAFKGQAAHRWVPRPVEGYRLFDAVRPAAADGRSSSDDLLGADDLTEGERVALRGAVAEHLRPDRVRFFVNKNTRNAMRVGYLAAAFPEAVFVHLVRHPIAATASMARVAFFPELLLPWRDGQRVRDLVANGEQLELLAAELWVHETVSCDLALAQLAASRTLEIRYEDFVDRPAVLLGEVLGRVGMSATDSVRSAVEGRRISSRNGPALDDIPSELGAAIWELTAGPASRFGYQRPRWSP